MNTRPDFRRRPLIEELEPRLLFSADLAPVMLDDSPIAAEQRLLGADGEFAVQASEQESAQLEVVFIDTRVDNYQQLLDDIRKQGDTNRTIEVVLIDSQRDGITQIGDYLAQQRDIDAIHIISHGSDGSIQLGSSYLDLDTLLQHAAQLSAWGNALSSEADILLYGCDVAAGTNGKAFVDKLAQLTGADVAASIDLTGSATRGGDWQLEYQDGKIETALALDAAGQHSWLGTLAAPTLDLDGNDSSGTGGADYATQYPAAGGPIAITDIDAKLADSDSVNLSSLTVSIGNLLDGASESLSAVTTGTSITASYASGTGVLTLSGADTAGHYQEVLRTITYQNTAVAPDRTARTITFQASDGSATSNLATATVSWDYVRDDFAPSAYNGNDGSTNWNGDWTEINDDGSATSGRVTVSGGVLGRDLGGGMMGDSTRRGVVRGVDLSGATNTQLSLDYRLTSLELLGNSTIWIDVSSNGGANWNTLLTSGGNTNWTTTSIDISAYASANTQIRILSSSNAMLSLSGSAQFDNVEVRSDASGVAPSVDLDANNSSGATGANFATMFTAGGAAVNVADIDASLADTDSATLKEMVATITNPVDAAAEFLSANVAGTSITASYDSSTATLTLSGTDTVAHYQQVLRTISYQNNAASPDPSSRLITFAASDGVTHSNVATATVAVISAPPSAPPALDLDADNSSGATSADFATAFTEGGSAVNVADIDASLTDTDSAMLTEMVATITNPLNGAAESLTATIAGTGIAASYNTATATLTLSGTDTVAHYQQVLRTIAYNNSSDNPDTTTRLITVSASDGLNHSNVANAMVTVAAVNDAPAITAPGPQSINEDTTLVFSSANGNALSLADVDANGNAEQLTLTASNGLLTLASTAGLSFSAGSGTNDASMTFSGTLADINAALESLSFAPTANYNGTANLQLLASDLGNTGSGGALSASASVAITVAAVNDPPVITSNGGGASAGVNVAENTTAVTTVAATDVDLPAQTLAYSIVGGADQALYTINSTTGALGFAAAPDFDAPADSNADNVYEVTVQVADGNGGVDTQAISVTVTNVNEAPSAVADSAAGSEDTPVTGNVLANDSDVDGNALNAVLVSGPSNGSLVLNPDGSFSYTPDANWNGSDNFTYVANDGAQDSTPATVTLTVNPVNDAPTAADTTINATEDTAYAGTSPAASDVDGDPVSYALGSAAANGTAVVNSSGSFSYTPNANFNGSDSFTYMVDDGNGGTNTYLVSVNVAAVNDAPTAANDSASGVQGTVISGNVLANDSDPDGDALSASLVAGPTHGSVVLNPDGSFSYTPNANFSGNDSFAYSASGGSLNSGVVTVTLTVSPTGNIPPDPPPPPEPPVDPEVPTVEPPPVIMPPAPPGNQPPVALSPLSDQEESHVVQVTLHGGYETAAPRLSEPIANGHEEFTSPTQLDAWLTQLLDTARVDDPGSTLNNLISPAVNIELTQDSSFKADIYAEEAKISALFLSAGAVWWGLRAGGLMASLLTSLPAWRSLDVLPVLRDAKKGEEVPWGPDEDQGRHPRQGTPENPPDEVAG